MTRRPRDRRSPSNPAIKAWRTALLLALMALPAAGNESAPPANPTPPSIPEPISAPSPMPENSYLEFALRTERWLRHQAVTTGAGKIWRSRDEKDDHPVTNGNLYYGSSGVVLFYLELYQQTGNPSFLEEAEDGARYLMAAVPDELYFARDLNALDLFPSLNQPAEGGIPVYTAANGLAHPNQASLYWGVSGIGFTLGEMARVTGKQAYRRAAWEIVDLLLRDHHADESGATWGSTPELQIGDAGVGLFLLYASRELEHPGAEKLALAIGQSLLVRAIESEQNLSWSTKRVYGSDYPNFAHGSAGIGYFLAALHQHTGDAMYLTRASGVGRYLVEIANADGLIAHHLPDEEGLLYYGWCHGPAGTNRLFEKLSLQTPTPQWSRFIERSNRAVLDAHLLDRKQAGFWQNVGQCCGSAGIADYFLQQYTRTQKPEYLDFARSMTADILQHASVAGDTLSWNHAEHRSSPEFKQTQTGYMQGAAGMGMHFLRMHAVTHHKPISIRLLDERL